LALAAACRHRMPRPDVAAIARKLDRAYAIARPTAPGAAPGLTEFLATVGLRFTEITRMLGENKESGTPFKEFLQQVCQHIACTLSGALEESPRTNGNLRDATSDLEARLTVLSKRVKKAG